MKYLITASLLNAFEWFYILSDKENSKEEFIKTLKKEYSEPNEAMKAGIKFENDIMSYCNDEYYSQDNDYDCCVKEIGDIVKGGTWQVSGKKDIAINNINYLLYGKADVLKIFTIYDIKFSKSFDEGKYKESTQHKLYFNIFPEMREFVYLVSDGKNVYHDSYSNDQLNIESSISDLWSWLNANPEYMKIFKNKWKAF